MRSGASNPPRLRPAETDAFEFRFVNVIGIERIAVRARVGVRPAAAEPGLGIQREIRLADIGGKRVGCDVVERGGDDRAQCLARRGRVGEALGVFLDEFIDGRCAGRAERHIVRREFLIAPSETRPMQADDEWTKIGTQTGDTVAICRAARHGVDPVAVLPFRRRHIALPTVAEQKDIGDRIGSEGRHDLSTHRAGRIISAFIAASVEGDEEIWDCASGRCFDRHGWLKI